MTLEMTSLPLARVFQCYFLHVRSIPFRADCSVDCAPKGNWRWNSNFRDVVASSPSFSLPAARVSRRACSQDNAAVNACFQERIMGQIGKRPVKPLEYVNFTRVIFRPIKRLKSIGSCFPERSIKLSFAVVKREFNSRHYNILYCLL